MTNQVKPMNRGLFRNPTGLLWWVAIAVAAIPISAQADAVPLFDGKTFAGWEGDTNNVWRIEQGEIVAGRPDLKRPKNDFLCTTREFGDFELRLKYRRGGNNGGVQFRSQRVPGSQEVSGYQADFARGIDGFLYDESRRRKFLARPDAETIKKLNLGQWNAYRIRAEGPRVRLWINDVLTVDYAELDEKIPRRGSSACKYMPTPRRFAIKIF
jgi:hypothetical protein